jgi:hypothetical protein
MPKIAIRSQVNSLSFLFFFYLVCVSPVDTSL